MAWFCFPSVVSRGAYLDRADSDLQPPPSRYCLANLAVDVDK